MDEQFGPWIKQSTALGNERTISLLLAAASKHAEVITELDKWDADENTVGVLNGLIDLRTLSYRPAAPPDYITKRLRVDYVEGASCPEWDKFINKVLPGELGPYICSLAGYTLSGSTDDQAFYFLHGSGKNGKSIFVETLSGLMGGYGRKAARELVEESKRGGDCKQHLAMLPGVRFLHGEETSATGKLREDVIKSLVGGDTLVGEAKYAPPFDFVPVAKLWIMGNHKPRIEGDDHGIWRRVRLIPFEVVISSEEEIPKSELLAKFDAERSGILNWMLGGISRCCGRPIPPPRAVVEAVEDYRHSEDELAEFIEAHVETDDAARLAKDQLHQRYQDWARECGMKCPLKRADLSRRLSARTGWTLDRGKRHWVGKRLIEESPEEDLR
ncbi:MAG: hypothetical protein EOP85_19065 [Verrucomicrobiaceae bacterium]|nr:MAG: hypothetical protein EOP85_19065 [Verrucomicrobiaceae bacterium]